MLDWRFILDEIKKATGYRSVDIAGILDVKPSYITEIEKGKSKNPKTSFIQALIIELGVNPYWLFKGEGDVLETDRSAQMSYEQIVALKSLSAYDLIQIAQLWVQNKDGPAGKEKTPDLQWDADQGKTNGGVDD
jgi:transcriptional regulator with XRE-family HTH domain